MSLITTLKKRAALRSRMRAWVHTGSLRLGGVSPDHIRVVKGGPSPRETRRVIRAICRVSARPDARAAVRRVQQDMHQLITRLSGVPTDPTPLPRTRYKTEGAAVKGCATPPPGDLLLYALVRVVQPANVIEVGTAHGYGACYMAAAMQANGRGQVQTLEGMNVRVAISRETLQRLGYADRVRVVPGDFRQTVPEVMGTRPDMVFSDGDKSVELTQQGFRLSVDAMPDGGWMFFDDINFSPEIAALWQRFVTDPRIGWVVTFYGRWGLLRVVPAGPSSPVAPASS